MPQGGKPLANVLCKYHYCLSRTYDFFWDTLFVTRSSTMHGATLGNKLVSVRTLPRIFPRVARTPSIFATVQVICSLREYSLARRHNFRLTKHSFRVRSRDSQELRVKAVCSITPFSLADRLTRPSSSQNTQGSVDRPPYPLDCLTPPTLA